MFENAEIISSYTRAQAIEDGVLVDVSKMAREAGFRVPVAMTVGFHSKAVACTDTETGLGQTPDGRLWDVLSVLKFGISMAKTKNEVSDRVNFMVRVQRGPEDWDTVSGYALIGPGDDPSPVMTIMLMGED